ncbi:hypothetical protein DAPPUDRAFT_60138 [Daphnia pulex]|uniref:Mediator of RNA polymerase II transcription subunit 13 n=1 Tax=Daphnia pulex TaxID=6669 RepID=E9H9X0_DAPPU|nr:hypothetical protein DAPPUDRAFT_60138 [Daphnia pulex]|eukprot:EFX71474.1 hypothetical protein DAPPUDRAFT_60138 [Daphnia pulex]
MAHPNSQTNGASLEDCHTNFFALTDLCGIRWRKLTSEGYSPQPGGGGPWDYLNDPVLLSYWRCLSNDILCVWRRIPSASSASSPGGSSAFPPSFPSGFPNPQSSTQQGSNGLSTLSGAKELWIFWYGDTSPDLSSLVVPEILNMEGEHGSWENGLSYECRSLLFKALHNLIERCLLSRDFIRLGKWFVQPQEGVDSACTQQQQHQQPDSSNPTTTIPARNGHLSFSFSFFVHGESTVCASIDVRQHPVVRKTTHRHLAAAQATSGGVHVMLAPYGLAGALTGVSYRSATDHVTRKLMEEWRQYYPVECGLEAASDTEDMVEVIVGNVRMRYPTCYVMVCDADRMLMTPPASPPLTSNPASISRSISHSAVVSSLTSSSAVTSAHHSSTTPTTDKDSTVNLWDFVDPTTKNSCICMASTTPLNTSSSSSSSSSIPSSSSSSSSSSGKRGGGVHPFHHRPTYAAPTRAQSTVASVGQKLLPDNNNAAAALPPGNSSLPLSSPHPPASNDPSSNFIPSTPSASDHNMTSQDQNCSRATPGGAAHTPGGGPKSNQAAYSPYVALPSPRSSAGQQPASCGPATSVAPTTPNVGSGGGCSGERANGGGSTCSTADLYGIKKIVLPQKEYEEELKEGETAPGLLYDYSNMTAWLFHPVKRMKVGNNSSNGDRPTDSSDGGSSCSGKQINGNLMVSDGVHNGQSRKRKEPDSGRDEDSNSLNSANAAGGAAKPVNPSSLFTSEGLQASYQDLDKIFDNSDESNDTCPVPTPPGSNKPAGLPEDTALMGHGHHKAPRVNILASAEFSNMFPTPPSHEHPMQSPCGQMEGSVDLLGGDMNNSGHNGIKSEPGSGHSLNGCSPTYLQEDSANKDWSYVYRPPTVWKVANSSKYAPLPILPSQTMSPLFLPAPYRPSSSSNSSANHSSGIVEGQPPGFPQHQPGFPHHHPPQQQLQLQIQQQQQQHHHHHQQQPQSVNNSNNMSNHSNLPECHSLMVNIVLGDSMLNIFRDHNFDSCTVCVCSDGQNWVGTIRGQDAVFYLPESSNARSSSMRACRCNCGFSALVNRHLAHQAGLFYEDEVEIVGANATRDPGQFKRGSLYASIAAVVMEASAPLVDTLPVALMELLREQCLLVHHSSSPLYRAEQLQAATRKASLLHALDYSDGCETARNALTQPHPSHGAHGHSTNHPSTLSAGNNGPIVHYWPFLHVQGPNSSQDVIRVMRTLQPLLQDSIQKKRAASLWRAPFAVQGPLTWRQFHRMAVRGTEDRCEPQPIPSVMAGYDRDWVAIGPLAIPHWDRLLLEPYSRQRDVAYIVLAPEMDYVLSRTKIFFKELSATYEMCRFGRHVPYKGLRDGILRVGKSAAAKLANDAVDDWFSNIGDSPIASLLRLYAKVCRYHLAPTLINMPMDRTLLDPPAPPSSNRPMNAVPSPMAPPSTTPIHPGDFGSATQSGMGPPNPGGSTPLQGSSTFGVHHTSTPSSGITSSDGKPTSPKTEDGADGTSGHGASGATDGSAADDEEVDPPSIVIYIVDPFSFGSDNLDLGRLTALGLLRCYHQMLSLLSETVQLNVSLQLISADAILQLGKDLTGASRYDSLRSLALNVFSQCKKLISQPSNVKSLTGFGPAAASDTFLKAKDERNRAPYRVYIPAYVLAPTKDRTVCDLDPGVSTNGGPGSGPLSFLARPDKYSVLYVSYCLSEDQRWLIAACTDERGELVDSCTIGIDVPNRTKRKRVSVRRFGLQRLMDFILGVISTGVHPWRLVIGRVGRMGHGELKSWSALLSRKNLLRASRHLADICGQCSLVFPSQAPTLVSACLVSLEPDSHFRMMPDQVTPDERFGQQSANSHLSTPEDASCTHILVFPTSATTRSPQTTFHEENINGPDLGDDDLLSALNDDMGDGFEGMSGFDDIFMTWPETDQVNDGTDDLTSDITGGNNGGMNNMGGCGTSRSPGASHGGGGGGSPGRGGMRSNMNPESPSGMGGHHHAGGSGRQSPRAEQEEVGTLLQQPLALGYYVSTAPTGDMPSWFWSSCPHLARACPAFLKCALHLHNHAVQQNSDDILLQQQQQQVNNSSKVHPLDSQVTTDVLRYVMEGYNALSWLSLDPKSRDRRSCLPIHIQLLVQLYHALAALV